MKTQDTPGPWLISQDAVPDWHVQITVYAEADGQRVATVFREKANAELIASAPAMLAALQEIALLLDCGNIDQSHWDDCLAVARAAIPALQRDSARLAMREIGDMI